MQTNLRSCIGKCAERNECLELAADRQRIDQQSLAEPQHFEYKHCDSNCQRMQKPRVGLCEMPAGAKRADAMEQQNKEENSHTERNQSKGHPLAELIGEEEAKDEEGEDEGEGQGHNHAGGERNERERRNLRVNSVRLRCVPRVKRVAGP